MLNGMQAHVCNWVSMSEPTWWSKWSLPIYMYTYVTGDMAFWPPWALELRANIRLAWLCCKVWRSIKWRALTALVLLHLFLFGGWLFKNFIYKPTISTARECLWKASRSTEWHPMGIFCLGAAMDGWTEDKSSYYSKSQRTVFQDMEHCNNTRGTKESTSHFEQKSITQSSKTFISCLQ